MKVILNTRPLLFAQKTGIGYYVHNLHAGLRARSGVEVLPTVGTAGQRSFTALSAVSSRLREWFGPGYNRIARPLGDFYLRMVTRGEAAGEADIYHETNLEPPDRPARRLVGNLYDLSFLRFPELLPREVVEKATRGLDVLRRADRVIVNSRFIRDEAVELLGIPADRIDVIPLAPSGDYGRRGAAQQDADRAAVARFVKGPYVLYVGTVEPRKGLPVLIEAVGLARREVPDLRLVVAGGLGWDYDHIVEKAAAEGVADAVVFTGYVDEELLGSLYRRAAVFVYPSTYEGFGIPPLEAMNCGVPVIVSDIPPLRELVGDGGIVFPCGRSEALAAELVRLMRSDAERAAVAARGRRRATAFSWERVLRETLETYRKALDREN